MTAWSSLSPCLTKNAVSSPFPINVAEERPVSRPHVIILNGVGSVGKSSTARALQTITAEPFLHVAMDAFLDMLPEAMLGHREGLIFETIEDQGKPSLIIRTGPVVERALQGMRHAIAAMAAQGNNLVVDDVMIGAVKAQEYRALLSRFDLRFVGLFAPLEVLEARERERGDRERGLARWQYDRVHRDIAYDLEIETSTTTPLQNAQKIRDAFGL
jgi:chloramphenicol 3-O phosphotransferase